MKKYTHQESQVTPSRPIKPDEYLAVWNCSTLIETCTVLSLISSSVDTFPAEKVFFFSYHTLLNRVSFQKFTVWSTKISGINHMVQLFQESRVMLCR